ncbi:MAG: hypothetical protein R3A48_11475 [Polyangiales bacterium]
MLVLTLHAGGAAAQTAPGNASQARALFERGVTAADELRWADAEVAFSESYALAPRPATLRNLALAHRALGRYTLAIEAFERVLAEGRPHARVAREFRRLVTEMRGQLSSLIVETTPESARLRVDAQAVGAGEPITLDPGEHALVGEARGHERRTLRVTLAPGERRRVRLDLLALRPAPAPRPFEATPPEASPTPGLHTRWWFWTIVGTVVAGAVLTTVLLVDTPNDPGCGTLGACFTPR